MPKAASACADPSDPERAVREQAGLGLVLPIGLWAVRE